MRREYTRTRYPGVSKVKGARSQFRVRLKLVDPKTGKTRDVERLVEAPSASAAARVRADLRQELESERLPEHRPLFRDYAISFLRGKKKTVRESTLRTYSDRLDHACDAFGDWFVDAIDRRDIEEWRDRQTDAPATVNGRLRTLRMVLRDAFAEGLVSRDPSERVAPLPQPHDEEDEEGMCLEPHELQALLDAVRRIRPRWYPMILMLAALGMRWCEASALKWSDLDLEEQTLRIRRSHVRGKVGPPKTKKSRRILPLPDELVAVLKDHRREQLRRQVRGLDHGWVFPSRAGTLMQPSSCRKPLLAAALEAGLAVRLGDEVVGRVPSSHWFRHTLNRLLRRAAEGVVQRSITGHVTERMAEHYDHVALHEKRAALDEALHLVTASRGSVDGGVDGDR